MDRSLRPKKLSDHRQLLPGWSSETELGGDIKLRVKHSPRLNLDTRCLQIKTIDLAVQALLLRQSPPSSTANCRGPSKATGSGRAQRPLS